MATELLQQIAEKIHEGCDILLQQRRTSLSVALTLGDLLAQAKELVPHGDWADWLREHFAGSARTASGYMLLAQHRAEVATKSATVADFGIARALRYVRRLTGEAKNRSPRLAPASADVSCVMHRWWGAMRNKYKDDPAAMAVLRDARDEMLLIVARDRDAQTAAA